MCVCHLFRKIVRKIARILCRSKCLTQIQMQRIIKNAQGVIWSRAILPNLLFQRRARAAWSGHMCCVCVVVLSVCVCVSAVSNSINTVGFSLASKAPYTLYALSDRAILVGFRVYLCGVCLKNATTWNLARQKPHHAFTYVDGTNAHTYVIFIYLHYSTWCVSVCERACNERCCVCARTPHIHSTAWV